MWLKISELSVVKSNLAEIRNFFLPIFAETIQPMVGGYFAVGVGGKIKNFEDREAQNSFSDSNFRRTDAGLRLGCGIGYDMFYADLTYDIGLANICHDTFDTSHNGALMLNVGVNF